MVGFRRSRIEVKSAEELALMREAGLVVAKALARVSAAVAPGVTTRQLDDIAAETIADSGATSNFLGYYGFPATICVSINEEIVHGIPGDRILEDGDLVSIDCGAIVSGWHGDAAVTVQVGEVRPAWAQLSEATRQSLWAGIAAVSAGARIGDIGQAVQASVEASAGRLGLELDIVEGYTGHGIGSAMHMPPDVPNFGASGKGPRLEYGHAIAIEPMVTLGAAESAVLDDDWTVVAVAGSPAAHWEHTVAVTPAGPWVLTAEDGGGLLTGDPLA